MSTPTVVRTPDDNSWDGFGDAGHFLQDTHGEQIARTVLERIGRTP